MIKFFRKIRQNLLIENKFSKYLFYAIGEIILVVIGILIAVQINNWNTNRNEITRLNSILNIVKLDLIKDTINISRPLKLYKEKNSQILNILENGLSISSLDTITELNNGNFNSFRNLITTYDLFQMQNKGISLLKNIATNIEYEKDTLITSLINSHSEYKLYFDEDNETMSNINLQVIEDYEKHPWFTDWLLGKYNKDMYHYFYNDEFKRKAGKYRMYSKQFLRDLKEYDNISKTYIRLIEKRLEK